ncbi:hypothetical protein KIN20_000157 [Parelaphostrongylus tenuis]|uniref:Uncharacterized protein n=1 Tax=Parelaphostrongylus tenuis TaxID=148309 RepID=A0AAD5LRR4_PARTN|nr:hypothetical protein KIN20_000157 [Parelaphostrongylus tenuis]
MFDCFIFPDFGLDCGTNSASIVRHRHWSFPFSVCLFRFLSRRNYRHVRRWFTKVHISSPAPFLPHKQKLTYYASFKIFEIH